MSDFCDSPMNSEFNPQGKVPTATKGVTVNGEDCAPFSEYKRTSSPNAVPEVTYDKGVGGISGESDQF